MSTSGTIDLDKLGRSSRRSATISGISLFIILASLGFGVYQLHTLQNQKAELTNEIERTKGDLELTKAELGKSKSELNEAREALRKQLSALGYPPTKIDLIIEYSFTHDTSGDGGRVSFTDEMEKADKELKDIKNEKPDVTRRSSVIVRYYVKQADYDRGIKAIRELETNRRFKTDTRNLAGDPDTPTNAIWLLSPNLPTQDIKLVAYTLIRRGIQIRYIGSEYPNPEKIKPLIGQRMIMVGGEPNYGGLEVWTVERIRNAASFK